MSAPTVHQIADALAPHLDRDRYHAEGDPAGVWIGSGRPVARLGLRIEPGRAPFAWADGLDAVLLHRPFGVWPARLPEGFGVLGVHRALDDRFALGPNDEVARALGLTVDPEPLCRDGHAIGRMARGAPQPLAEAERRIQQAFGGVEDAVGQGPETAEAFALMGAMTDALVREAAERGAGLYVTGQIRKPGVAAAEACGLRVLAVGQDRAEAWALRRIGAVVQRAFPNVEIVDRTA